MNVPTQLIKMSSKLRRNTDIHECHFKKFLIEISFVLKVNLSGLALSPFISNFYWQLIYKNF